jgi:hypothetical protein
MKCAEKLKRAQAQKGDILLYTRNDGKYVLQRVVCIHENCYDLRGNRQYFTKKKITSDQIIAVVKQFRRNGTMHKTNELG